MGTKGALVLSNWMRGGLGRFLSFWIGIFVSFLSVPLVGEEALVCTSALTSTSAFNSGEGGIKGPAFFLGVAFFFFGGVSVRGKSVFFFLGLGFGTGFSTGLGLGIGTAGLALTRSGSSGSRLMGLRFL